MGSVKHNNIVLYNLIYIYYLYLYIYKSRNFVDRDSTKYQVTRRYQNNAYKHL